MCGLYGFSGPQPCSADKIMLLALDAQIRGVDSTGLYKLGKGTFKLADRASVAVYKEDFREYASGNLIIGHTRMGTHGAKTVDNAHPFMYKLKGGGTLAGAHNGWLINANDHSKKLGISLADWQVDSQIYFLHLLKTGLSLKAIHEDIYAAAALTFSINDRLYLYRKSSKPLFVGQGDDGIYYSSRAEGLKLIGTREPVQLFADIFYVFKEGILIDEYYYGASKITLPMDCLPSQWRSNVSTEERKAIPGEDFFHGTGQSGSTQAEASTTQSQKRGSTEKIGTKDSIVEIATAIQKGIIDKDPVYKQFFLEEKERSYNSPSSRGYASVVFRLQKIGAAGGLGKFTGIGFPLEDPDNAIMIHDGLAIMNLGKLSAVKDVKFVFADHTHKYFAITLTIKPAAVLGVTAILDPFRKAETQVSHTQGDIKDGAGIGCGDLVDPSCGCDDDVCESGHDRDSEGSRLPKALQTGSWRKLTKAHIGSILSAPSPEEIDPGIAAFRNLNAAISFIKQCYDEAGMVASATASVRGIIDILSGHDDRMTNIKRAQDFILENIDNFRNDIAESLFSEDDEDVGDSLGFASADDDDTPIVSGRFLGMQKSLALSFDAAAAMRSIIVQLALSVKTDDIPLEAFEEFYWDMGQKLANVSESYEVLADDISEAFSFEEVYLRDASIAILEEALSFIREAIFAIETIAKELESRSDGLSSGIEEQRSFISRKIEECTKINDEVSEFLNKFRATLTGSLVNKKDLVGFLPF